MKIKISGSSGYIGSVISKELKSKGHQVKGINRSYLYGDVSRLAGELKNSDAVIHLAGAPILRRWTKKNKNLIFNSRVVTAINLAKAIKSLKAENRPRKVISASGISIFKPGESHSEKSTSYNSGFLGEVVKNWEKAWQDFPKDVELTIFRMAVVLGKTSPAIKTMLFPFKMGVGGKIASGKQPFPFIHEQDVARAYIWALENPLTNGIYVLAEPTHINNEEFTKEFAKSLNRPAFMRVPAFALKLIYGEAATTMTESPAVYPENLLRKGFHFRYPDIHSTLKEIFA